MFSCVAFVWLVMTVVRVSLLSYYCVFGNMLMFHPGLLLLSQIISRAVVKVVIPTERYVVLGCLLKNLCTEANPCCPGVSPKSREYYLIGMNCKVGDIVCDFQCIAEFNFFFIANDEKIC